MKIEGVSEDDLERCIEKMNGIVDWVRKERIDHWAFRAALIEILYGNADEYFSSGGGTFREIAAFDNAVATALKKLKNQA